MGRAVLRLLKEYLSSILLIELLLSGGIAGILMLLSVTGVNSKASAIPLAIIFIILCIIASNFQNIVFYKHK